MVQGKRGGRGGGGLMVGGGLNVFSASLLPCVRERFFVRSSQTDENRATTYSEQFRS
jgi:hypothetical protein